MKTKVFCSIMRLNTGTTLRVELPEKVANEARANDDIMIATNWILEEFSGFVPMAWEEIRC